MSTFESLLEQYRVLEDSDKNEFQRRARLLQSIWRTEQGYECGTHAGKDGPRPLGSRLAMPWAKETLSNYITPTIRDVAREEVLNPKRREGKLYKKPRIFNDLLSSQPLCFNLFAELKKNPRQATKVFAALSPGRIAEVDRLEFEHSPGRGKLEYLGDRTAFDVYIEFKSPNGCLGFAGIEVKYHEDLAGGKPPSDCSYKQVAENMSCFKDWSSPEFLKPPFQQIWRDHLLAGSILRTDSNKFKDGFFVFLYPKENTACEAAVKRYRNCLTDQRTFVVWQMEQVHETIKQQTQAAWIDLFYDRYLNFSKIDKLMA